MRHGYFGRKLGRNKDERRRLFLNLVRSLIQSGRIRTTYAKAKSVQPMMEKLITKAKAATSGAVSEMIKTLADTKSMKLLMEMAGTRFAHRTSGYTRIVRLGRRVGDAAEMVYLEFVDAAPVAETSKKTKTINETKIASKIQEADVVKEVKPKKSVKKQRPVPKVK